MKTEVILYFDGVCGLCNEYVDFIMKRDRMKKFMFSPLQSQYAKTNLPGDLVEKIETMALTRNQRIFTKSDAVIEVCKVLGGFWGIARIAYVVPRVLRDWVYDRVASRRHQWFGKNASCRVPTPTEKERFLL